MLVGDIRIDPLIDGEFAFTPDLLYPFTQPSDWQGEHARWVSHDGLMRMPFGCFLVRTGERIVLVDAGLGPLDHPGLKGGALLDEMRALGLTPADVTDVVFTHLHFDHVGWASQQGTVVFTNAVHRCHQLDWDHFIADEAARPKLEPLLSTLQPFDGATTIAPGIDTLPAPGHTPGHTAIVISSGEQRALLLGDAAHCPAEMEEADWDGISDVDPVKARAMRAELMRRIEAEQIPTSASHFQGLMFGRVVSGSGKPRWFFD